MDEDKTYELAVRAIKDALYNSLMLADDKIAKLEREAANTLDEVQKTKLIEDITKRKNDFSQLTRSVNHLVKGVDGLYKYNHYIPPELQPALERLIEGIGSREIKDSFQQDMSKMSTDKKQFVSDIKDAVKEVKDLKPVEKDVMKNLPIVEQGPSISKQEAAEIDAVIPETPPHEEEESKSLGEKILHFVAEGLQYTKPIVVSPNQALNSRESNSNIDSEQIRQTLGILEPKKSVLPSTVDNLKQVSKDLDSKSFEKTEEKVIDEEMSDEEKVAKLQEIAHDQYAAGDFENAEKTMRQISEMSVKNNGNVAAPISEGKQYIK